MLSKRARTYKEVIQNLFPPKRLNHGVNDQGSQLLNCYSRVSARVHRERRNK